MLFLALFTRIEARFMPAATAADRMVIAGLMIAVPGVPARGITDELHPFLAVPILGAV
jgi:hypothetical protein